MACFSVAVGLTEQYRTAITGRGLLEKPREHILFVVESGTKGLGNAIDNIEEYMEAIGRLRYRGFGTSGKHLLSLNVADFLAYECSKSWKDFTQGKQSLRYPLKTLLAGVPHHFVHLFGPELVNLGDVINAHLTELESA